MLSNKRPLPEELTPEASLKRRCMFTPSASGSGGQCLDFGSPLRGFNVTAAAVGSPANARPQKRRREADGAAMSQVEALLAEIRALRRNKAEQELIQRNLKQACENQQQCLVPMQQENRLLKRSVVALNAKREAAEHDAAQLREELQRAALRIKALEEANVQLCVQQQHLGPGRCASNNFGGGGPAVF